MLTTELVTLLRRFGFDDLSTAECVLALNEAYEDILDREPWPFLEVTNAAVTVNASGKVTAPTDIKSVLSLVDTSKNRTLFPRRLDSHRSLNAGSLTLTGDPTHYYFLGNDLYVWPIPSTNTLTLDYLKRPAVLDDSPDVTPILPSNHGIIVMLAASILAPMDDDTDLGEYYERRVDRRIERVRAAWWTRQYDEVDTILDVDADDDADWMI